MPPTPTHIDFQFLPTNFCQHGFLASSLHQSTSDLTRARSGHKLLAVRSISAWCPRMQHYIIFLHHTIPLPIYSLPLPRSQHIPFPAFHVLPAQQTQLCRCHACTASTVGCCQHGRILRTRTKDTMQRVMRLITSHCCCTVLLVRYMCETASAMYTYLHDCKPVLTLPNFSLSRRPQPLSVRTKISNTYHLHCTTILPCSFHLLPHSQFCVRTKVTR